MSLSFCLGNNFSLPYNIKEIMDLQRHLTPNSSDCIVMMRPASFGQNPETVGDNKFQLDIKQQLTKEEIHNKALKEFDNYVNILTENGIKVITVQDTIQPAKPDAIFPNNWFSTDPKKIIIYPMMSKNRRLQRKLPVFAALEEQGFSLPQFIDLCAYQQEQEIVQGTGSMVFDHQNKLAYACKSERTTEKLFKLICSKHYGYLPIFFTAKDHHDNLIYHTNVMISVGSNYVIVCLECIQDQQERKKVKASILLSKGINGKSKVLIELTIKQVENFCGNVLEVKNKEGKLFLVVGEGAYSSFTKDQIEQIEKHVHKIIVVPIPTIEVYGGGGARCMLAEVFLNKK